MRQVYHERHERCVRRQESKPISCPHTLNSYQYLTSFLFIVNVFQSSTRRTGADRNDTDTFETPGPPQGVVRG